MTVFCEITTLQPDGVDPYIPYEVFAASYTFLADKMGVDVLQAATVCSFLRDLSTANFDLVGPRDFMAPECPDLYWNKASTKSNWLNPYHMNEAQGKIILK